MIVVIGEETLDDCKYYYCHPRSFSSHILQVLVDDPDPDDRWYLNLLNESSLTVMMNKDSMPRKYSVVRDSVSPYFIKYDEDGRSQVTMNFIVTG